MKKRLGSHYLPVIHLVLIATSWAGAQQREAQPVEFKPVGDNLYVISGGRGANGGCYIGDEGVLVIDAKQDQASMDQVFAEIKKLTDKPILFLVNTHSDGDHISGNKFFPECAVIVAHENCRKEFFHPGRDGSPSAWESPELTPFVPQVTYQNKMAIWLGAQKVELWYFGVGHTTGDSVVYIPEAKTAFLGDQIFMGRAQLIHSYKGGNSFAHVKTLSKMLEILNAEKFSSGHADVISREEIKIHIQDMQIRQEKVKDLKNQGKSLDDVKAAFPENESRLIESIFNEIK